MYTLKKISKELLKTDQVEPKGHFVAACVELLADGRAAHAGIVFHCSEGYFLFHFNAKDIELEEGPVGWYYHKAIEFILPEFCDQFLGHCRKIKEKAKPRYGIFYPGSYYNRNGEYFADSSIPEYMSCVGFCINVIKGFLESEEYFSYEDWNEVDFNKKYLEEILKDYKSFKPDIKEEDISPHIRRILPSEFLASSFMVELPIRRKPIREMINNVNQAFKEKRSI